MNKREFIQQYVLNRALGNTGGLDGPYAAREGARAWDEIEKLAPAASAIPKGPPINKDSSTVPSRPW